jgi:EmrB/QacA subfamily drug resistance transporter
MSTALATPPLPADPDVHARRWRTLGVLCLSLTIVMVANLSLNLALPSMARDLDASTGELQWIVDAYALVFAGLLFSAGTLGDRYGRKGSAASAIAETADLVIGGRVVMGLAAALVMPSTLSIISNVFPPEERGRAIALWAGVAAGGAALGPASSGLLLEHFWWGSVFLVNVPLALAALVAGRRLVPTSRDPERRPVDVAGAVLSIVGVGALVFAIIEAPEAGWTAGETVAGLAVAALGLGLFAWRELTARHPMLDLHLFRDRRFGVATGGIALTYFTLFGTFFLLAQFLQLVLGLSPLAAGLVQLPVSITMLLVAPRVPWFVDRYSARRVVAAGLGLLAVGMAVASLFDADTPAVLVALSFVLPAVGISATGAPLTTLMMAAVPPTRAGMGSATNNASRELGGALGVAILGSLLSTRYTASLGSALAGLPAGEVAAAERGLSGALAAAEDLPAAAGRELAAAARGAFVDGFSTANLTAAGLAVAVSVGAWLLLPGDAEEAAGAAEDVDAADDVEPAVALTVGDGDAGVAGAVTGAAGGG